MISYKECLYLNVWTPACSANEKLPVFVWYFGGVLQFGDTAEMEFDGERIARRGIVVVTVNYRLNVFGFLCHPEITAEAPEAPANFGNLDQRVATQWVKMNIEAFGGDPNNITIRGKSALFLQNKRLMVLVLLGHTSFEFINVPNANSIEELREMAIEMFEDHAEIPGGENPGTFHKDKNLY